MSVTGFSFLFSALFIAPVMSQMIGLKKTICISFLGYISYIAANFAPSWATLIPTSVLTGLSAAPLWLGSANTNYYHIKM